MFSLVVGRLAVLHTSAFLQLCITDCEGYFSHLCLSMRLQSTYLAETALPYRYPAICPSFFSSWQAAQRLCPLLLLHHRLRRNLGHSSRLPKCLSQDCHF